MKVVIAGTGEMGIHLAKMLSKENHDIVLLDDSSEKLAGISNDVDLMTVTGSAHSFNDLKETGLSKADLFIAVTPFEERNLLACSMASYLGAKKTIARINNSEYMQENYKTELRNLGIHELIYPESLAAKEIVTSLKQPGTRQIIEFSNGKLILLGIKVRENAQILNKTFEELSKEINNIFVVAINRNNETIIPNGHDFIKNGDIVFFVTTRAGQQNVFDLTGKTIFDIKNVMFLGGSRIAQKTIDKLGDQYRIKIIEIDRNKCEKIVGKYENVLVINGDGRDLSLLKEEGIEKMDAFIATTGNSETNILSCHLAKYFGVRRTIAEVENLAFMSLADNMDIGTIVNKKLNAASYIYRFTLNAEVSKVKRLAASDAEVFEFIAKPGAKITQHPIKSLGFPEEAKIGGIIRGNNAFIVNGDTEIAEGDKVVVFTLPSGIKKLEKFFK
ncbi:MAG: Trk system potassium transporter TrkA [Bacteroidales bacterium]|jgi:trk system potassium uptake protein TrkA|nr:Trk system potassium transporter TrkA [Bacteroidales bacterium]